MSDHFISFGKAKAMTSLYQSNRDAILLPELRGQDILCISEWFPKDCFDALFAQNNCEGIRFYYGMDTEKKVHIIAVGTEANGNDIVTPDENSGTGPVATAVPPAGGIIVEESIRCPTVCTQGQSLGGN